MQGSVWSLPGPAQFVETIRDELTSGRCVIVLMPSYAPDDLREALRRTVSDAWSWAEVDARNVASPAAALCQIYGVQPGPTSAATIQALANDDSFAGQLLWLSPSDVASWATWKPFLVQYADACRGVPEGKNSLFITLLRG